jgi:hypothetical protein
MDTNVISYVSILLSVGAIVVGAINHKRIRSNCLGHKGEISIDIEQSSPVRKENYQPPVVNP